MYEPVPLSALFAQLLQAHGLKSSYLEARLRHLWPQLMGEAIAAHTTSLYLRGDTLYVGLSSAVLRWELSLQRDALRVRLNVALGEEALLRIVLK